MKNAELVQLIRALADESIFECMKANYMDNKKEAARHDGKQFAFLQVIEILENPKYAKELAETYLT